MTTNDNDTIHLAALGDIAALNRILSEHSFNREYKARKLAMLAMLADVAHPLTDVVIAAILRGKTPLSILQRCGMQREPNDADSAGRDDHDARHAACAFLMRACRTGDANAASLLLHIAQAGLFKSHVIMGDAETRRQIVQIARYNSNIAAHALKTLGDHFDEREIAIVFHACIGGKKTASEVLTSISPDAWALINPNDRRRLIHTIEWEKTFLRDIAKIFHTLNTEERLLFLSKIRSEDLALLFLHSGRFLNDLNNEERLAMISLALKSPTSAASAVVHQYDALRPDERDILIASAALSEEKLVAIVEEMTDEKWRAMSETARRIVMMACCNHANAGARLIQRAGQALSSDDVRTIVTALMRSAQNKSDAAAEIVSVGEAVFCRLDDESRRELWQCLARSPLNAARAASNLWSAMNDNERSVALRAVDRARSDEDHAAAVRLTIQIADDLRAMTPEQRAPLVRRAMRCPVDAACVFIVLHSVLSEAERDGLARSLETINDGFDAFEQLMRNVANDLRAMTPEQRAPLVRSATRSPLTAACAADVLWGTMTEKEWHAVMNSMITSPSAVISFIEKRTAEVRAMEPEQRAPAVRAALVSHDSSLKAARLLWDALRETEKRNFADVAMNARQYGAGKELLVIAWDYLDNDRRRSVLSDVLDRLSDKKLESITRNDVEWLVENACGRYGFASVVIEKLAHAMTDGEIAELMRVSDTKRLFGPPKIDCNRLACMNREDRHVFFQCVGLSEDQQSLEFVDRVHQFIDDAERAMLLMRIGIDSMHVAQMLSIGAPWRDWMFEYAPENHDSDEINAAWLAIVNQLPPAAAARLLRICAGGDNRHRLRSVHR